MELFKSVINFLTGIAIFIAIINFYFKANKIWKRKHEKEVSASQSIVALSSEGVLYILWSISFILNRDWSALADNAIGLMESAFFIVIGSGLFIIEKNATKKSFWNMLKEALRVERKEATYLFNLISGKSQAEKIIKILREIAWIDNDFDKSEIELIRNHAINWNLRLNEKEFNTNPFLENNSESERFENIKFSLRDFLKDNPAKEQVNQLKKIFQELISADGKIDRNEDLIIGELDGIILEYLGEPVPIFNVIIIPQEEKHRIIIEDILKDIYPNIDISTKERKVDGGYGFVMQECYSQLYAELVADEERNQHKLMTIIQKDIKKNLVN